MSLPRDNSQLPCFKEWNADVWDSEHNQNGNAMSFETDPLNFNHRTHCASRLKFTYLGCGESPFTARVLNKKAPLRVMDAVDSA